MSKKLFCITTILVILMVALASCKPAATAAGPVTITIWHGYTETEATLFEKVVTDFMAANTDVKVELLAVPFDQLQNKFQTEAANGTGPTLVTGPQDRMAAYNSASLLATIDDKATFLADLVPASVEGGKIGGKLVGVPINNKVVALFYNKSLVDSVPADFGALLEVAKTKGLILTADWFHNYMWAPAFGAKLFDDTYKCVLDSAEGVAAYEYFKTVCASEGVTCDSNDGNGDTLFREGSAAFRIQGVWASSDYQKDLGAENVGVAAIPTIPGESAPRPWNQSEMISINVNAKEAEVAAAMKFIAYLTSTDVQKQFLDTANWIPANSKVDTSGNPVVGGFISQVANSDPFPVAAELSAVWTPLGDAITKIVQDVLPTQDALTEAVGLINTTNKK